MTVNLSFVFTYLKNLKPLKVMSVNTRCLQTLWDHVLGILIVKSQYLQRDANTCIFQVIEGEYINSLKFFNLYISK